MIRRLSVAAAALALTIGCGKSEQQKQAEATAQAAQQAAQASQQAAQGAQTAAQGAQTAAQGLQQMAQALQSGQGQVKMIESDTLKTLLPEVSGWERKNSKSEQVSMGVASMSHAETHYEAGDQEIKLDITDSAMSQLLLAPVVMYLATGYSEKTDDGYKKAVQVGGYPGFESWDKSSKRAEVAAVVGNRFIVAATDNNVESVDPVRKLVETVDLAKLAGLK
jgi:glucose/arabinose dehydrogenase